MRVPRTFAFLDLSGFTNYTAAYGDDAAGRILGTFRTLVREIASERGVRVAKWLGDGCMIVSVEQRALIEFVMDLERRASAVCAPLTLRAGIATGHALLFEGDDYSGSAVNLAARLCDHAQNFDVLMPTMHLDRLPEGITAEPFGEIELRGFPGKVDVVRLTGAPTPAAERGAGELSTPNPLVLLDPLTGGRSASALGVVQRGIRVGEHRPQPVAADASRETDARRDRQPGRDVLPVLVIGRVLDAHAKGLGGRRVEAREHQHELVTGVPRHEV